MIPVALFAYNRPWHTRQTLTALMGARLAEKSALTVFCDGAPDGAEAAVRAAVDEVRRIVRERPWCGRVRVIERPRNFGLMRSIIDGVSQLCAEAGSVIVLEDDLLVSAGFLEYMNAALQLYRDDDQVMEVSAYLYPLPGPLPETFFYNVNSCWGWGTWQRAWRHLVREPLELQQRLQAMDGFDLCRFNGGQGTTFSDQLAANAEGTIETWAVRWHASMFLRQGLCLHPRCSLVRNIGHDGSGRHCGINEVLQHQSLADRIAVTRQELAELPNVRGRMAQFMAARKPAALHASLWARSFRSTKALLRRWCHG